MNAVLSLQLHEVKLMGLKSIKAHITRWFESWAVSLPLLITGHDFDVHIVAHSLLYTLKTYMSMIFSLTTYRIVASRSTCYYSGNQKFCFFKSRLVTCRKFFYEQNFFVCQDRKLKYSASYWFRISWILTKVQLIRTTFIFRSPCY